MNEIKQSTPNREEDITSSKFWGTIVMAGISLLVFGYFFAFLLRLDKTPIIYAAMAIFLFAIIVSLIGMVLTVRGRQETGAKVTFYMILIVGITIASVLQGRTQTASFSILIISVIAILYLLPSQWRRWYFLVAVVSFLLMWVVEWLNPSWRVQISAAKIGPAAVVAFVLVMVWMAFYQTRQAISRSLRLQITTWTGAIIAVLSIIIIAYSITTSRQAAINNAQIEALSVSEAHAGDVKNQIEPALNTARTLASSLGIVKDPKSPFVLTREQANAMLRKVEEANPAFLGTWTLWEPNAFDGLDAQYANTPLSDSTGRFIPYWVRGGADNTVEGVAIVDYETPKPGVNDWYFIPRETQKETLSTPYLYPINDVNVLMTTLSVPIIENNKFYGVAGVDLKIDFVQNILDSINLYNGTATSVLLTDTGSLVAVRNQPELALQPATSLYADFDKLQPRISAGNAFVSLSPDGKYLRVFSPVEIGGTNSHWSLSLIIPFSEITASATASAVREVFISVVLIVLALLALWYLTGQIVQPIRELTTVANAISEGNLNAAANIDASNETGILANAFNSMTTQLRSTLSTLEARVAERTRNLELSAEVGRTVSQVRALDILLKDAAELIRSQFNLYYVQVYLVNPSQTYLELQSGTGHVGEQLVARSHRLPLNTGSINGRAAIERKPVVISDTMASATFKPNPLLPETRSEMTVPLLVGDKVVGVLDMQSQIAGSLSQDALPAFEALAGQLAIAIQNANLLAETQQARAEVEGQIRKLARANWREYLDAIHKPEHTGYVFDGKEVTPLANIEEMQSASEADAIAAPIEITGESIGSLVVEGQTGNSQELVKIVAHQVAQQIESLRLLESAERYRLEAEEAAGLATIEGWKKYIESRPENMLGYMYDSVDVKTLDKEPENSTLTLPIKVGDEMIGKISVQGLETPDEQALDIAKSVIETLGAHIENLRLLEETKRGQLELNKRALDLAAVSEISSASARELDIQKLLETVVHLTQRKFGLYHAHVFTFNERTAELQIAACGWKEGDEHEGTHGTTSIPLDQEQSLVARAARSQQPVIVNDVHNEPGWLPNPLLPDTRSEMAVPLIVGDQILGVLDVQSDVLNAFSQEDANIQTALASQIATALQNARTFSQAQGQAQREAMLNTISQKIQSATSVEAVLQIAARELGRALSAPLTVAQLGVKSNGGNSSD